MSAESLRQFSLLPGHAANRCPPWLDGAIIAGLILYIVALVWLTISAAREGT